MIINTERGRYLNVRIELKTVKLVVLKYGQTIFLHTE